MIRKFIGWIKRLFGFLIDNGVTLSKVGVCSGVAAAAVGARAGLRAKKVNKKAQDMRDKAISDFQKSNTETEAVLGKLGDTQIEMIETFDTFVETMEKIMQRPGGLKNKISRVTLPEYKPEDLKMLSNDLQMALAGAGGVAIGMGIGAAAFGINALALGPGALVGGVVLCVKGVSLSRKAIKNKREAVKLKKDVERIVMYHSQLRVSASMLYQTLEKAKYLYLPHLSALKALVAQKTDYRTYTKDEKLLVKNSILLVGMMHDMCKATLVHKADKEGCMETVNEKDVRQIVESANATMAQIKPVLQMFTV